MTDTGPSSAVPRWPRWKGILLVASLALNLLIFGIVAAAGIKHGWGSPHSIHQATLLRFARTLPDERRHEIWNIIRPQIRTVRPYWRELRKARADVRTALTAEPFDAQSYHQAHDRLLDAEMKARKAIHPIYDNVATLLTAEERREFARWQTAAERPWRKHKRNHKSPDPESDDADNETPQKSQAAPVSATPPPKQ